MLFRVHFLSCIIHLPLWEREKDIKIKQLFLKDGSMSFVIYFHKQFQLALNPMLGGKCSDKFDNGPHYAILWFDLRRKSYKWDKCFGLWLAVCGEYGNCEIMLFFQQQNFNIIKLLKKLRT